MWEWVAIPSSRGSSQLREWICISYVSPALAGRFFTTSAIWEATVSGMEMGFVVALGFPVVQMVKSLPAMWETQVWPLGREDPLE